MKVVRIRHTGDPRATEYLFSTTRNLKKGDYVLCSVKQDKEDIGICTADSIEIKKETLEYLSHNSGWTFPLKPIIGKMDRWIKETDNE